MSSHALTDDRVYSSMSSCAQTDDTESVATCHHMRRQMTQSLWSVVYADGWHKAYDNMSSYVHTDCIGACKFYVYGFTYPQHAPLHTCC